MFSSQNTKYKIKISSLNVCLTVVVTADHAVEFVKSFAIESSFLQVHWAFDPVCAGASSDFTISTEFVTRAGHDFHGGGICASSEFTENSSFF